MDAGMPLSSLQEGIHIRPPWPSPGAYENNRKTDVC